MVGVLLDYCDVEWFALETNQDHSVIFEFDPSTAFQTLGDYEGYFISSKGFLLTVVSRYNKFDTKSLFMLPSLL